MEKKLSKYFLLFATAMMILSCKKVVLQTHQTEPKTFSQVFDQFWGKMNTNYVYWDIDTTNWNHIYLTYKPLFSQLDLNNEQDVKKSVSYFRYMTNHLIDNHYYIQFTNLYIVDSSIYPAFSRKQFEPTFHYPYAYYRADTSYLDSGFVMAFDNINSFNGVPLIAVSGTVNHKILYFSCNHFALYQSYQNQSASSAYPVLNYFFSQAKDSKYKGIIIDVRSNQGGDIGDLNFLLGHLIDKPLFFGFTQSKSNSGPYEFTPWVEAVVNPQPDAKQITVPIVVLADNVSASLSETLVMAVHAMPNGISIGERTWGATGPVTDEEVYNDGQFTIDGFMQVQTSSCKFKYIDGKIYEDIGFPPDIPVSTNSNDLANGKDLQLEKAISQIR